MSVLEPSGPPSQSLYQFLSSMKQLISTPHWIGCQSTAGKHFIRLPDTIGQYLFCPRTEHFDLARSQTFTSWLSPVKQTLGHGVLSFNEVWGYLEIRR